MAGTTGGGRCAGGRGSGAVAVGTAGVAAAGMAAAAAALATVRVARRCDGVTAPGASRRFTLACRFDILRSSSWELCRVGMEDSHGD